jgi:alkyldihydroxyacetonephosphate synthase
VTGGVPGKGSGMAAVRRRSWWGWGWADEALSAEQVGRLGEAVAARPGFDGIELRRPPEIADLALRAPRIEPPAALADLCSTDLEDRAGHTYGKSFVDTVRGFHGDLPHPPDLVARPRTEADVGTLLDWCADAGVAAIPYGGGSSVVGGVACDVGDGYAGVVSVDLTGLDRVLEIDRTSRAARVQGGALGPVLEDQLRPHDLTLRHFPQSFEFSTVGGWIATRSGGHYATNHTHIDDFVESVRAVTPAGTLESRRLPGSGAGPSPDRLLLGSEGILGIITEAWLRLQDRPRFKASAGVRFPTFAEGAAAARAVVQANLWPSNLRLLDAGEAAGSAGVTDGSALLVVGFESADHPLDAAIGRAVELCADHGGRVPEGVRSSSEEGAAGAWRGSFLRAPYGRDALVALGCIAETFETACTWDAFDELHRSITEAVGDALVQVCGGGSVTCRFTHVYPDGPAPYFTVLAPSRHGSQAAQWAEIKAAASEAILAAGGTITHHHAVGRDHRPWYDRQRPDLFAAALRAAKATVDPNATLNPGVLVDPS